MARWKVWYIDGTTFDSTEGTPADAPAKGVVCIAQPDIETGREILNRWPAYFRFQDKWRKATEYQIFDRLLNRQRVNAYLDGASPSNSEFRTIWLEAKREVDPQLGVKTARSGDESPYFRDPQFIEDEFTR